VIGQKKAAFSFFLTNHSHKEAENSNSAGEKNCFAFSKMLLKGFSIKFCQRKLVRDQIVPLYLY